MKLKLEIDTSGTASKLVDVLALPHMVIIVAVVVIAVIASSGLFIFTLYLR